jgi:hypothetical protein
VALRFWNISDYHGLAVDYFNPDFWANRSAKTLAALSCEVALNLIAVFDANYFVVREKRIGFRNYAKQKIAAADIRLVCEGADRLPNGLANLAGALGFNEHRFVARG